jgi:hypothetical protein
MPEPPVKHKKCGFRSLSGPKTDLLRLLLRKDGPRPGHDESGDCGRPGGVSRGNHVQALGFGYSLVCTVTGTNDTYKARLDRSPPFFFSVS